MGGRRAAALFASAFLLVSGASCAAARKHGTGDPCELNSECAAPLVCRLGACRRECATDRDCPHASCIRDENGLGVCQVPSEASCAVPSDCHAPLVCASMQCVNACAESRDCPPGNTCNTAIHACEDTAAAGACVRDSECDVPYRCMADARCHLECLLDRDCRYGTVCSLNRCVTPGTDAGSPDGGSPDGGSPDASCPTPSCGPATVGVTKLALSFESTCALLTDGRVACWGSNTSGVLGSSCAPTTFSETPVIVDGITGATDLFASVSHVCAVVSGTVHCWGGNGGRESDPTTAIDVHSPATVAVPGTVTAGAGAAHLTFAAAGNELYAWGDPSGIAFGDSMAELGPPMAPVHVGTFSGMRQLAAWRHGGCFMAAGIVSCWGANLNGQAGQGTSGTEVPVPTVVTPLMGVTELRASENLVCARSGTNLSCWGDNTTGAVGDGTSGSNQPTPSTVALGDVTGVAVGLFATCALRTSGVVTCWGANDGGQLGDGMDPSVETMRATPTIDVGLSMPAVAIGAGGYHACAVLTSGAVECWGENGSGQLGRPVASTTLSTTPLRVGCLP